MGTAKLGNPKVRYHRNGCHFAGFHTVSFTEGRGAKKQFLRAIVFDAADHVAVVNLCDAGARYRGDHYEPALRVAIAAAADNPAVYSHDELADGPPA